MKWIRNIAILLFPFLNTAHCQPNFCDDKMLWENAYSSAYYCSAFRNPNKPCAYFCALERKCGKERFSSDACERYKDPVFRGQRVSKLEILEYVHRNCKLLLNDSVLGFQTYSAQKVYDKTVDYTKQVLKIRYDSESNMGIRETYYTTATCINEQYMSLVQYDSSYLTTLCSEFFPDTNCKLDAGNLMKSLRLQNADIAGFNTNYTDWDLANCLSSGYAYDCLDHANSFYLISLILFLFYLSVVSLSCILRKNDRGIRTAKVYKELPKDQVHYAHYAHNAHNVHARNVHSGKPIVGTSVIHVPSIVAGIPIEHLVGTHKSPESPEIT